MKKIVVSSFLMINVMNNCSDQNNRVIPTLAEDTISAKAVQCKGDSDFFTQEFYNSVNGKKFTVLSYYNSNKYLNTVKTALEANSDNVHDLRPLEIAQSREYFASKPIWARNRGSFGFAAGALVATVAYVSWNRSKNRTPSQIHSTPNSILSR